MKLGLYFKERYDIQPPDVFKAPVGIFRTKDEVLTNLTTYARINTKELFTKFGTSDSGLTHTEAKRRLEKEHGYNEITHEERQPLIIRLALTFNNPLTMLLMFLVFISFVTGDMRSVIVVSSMILISVGLKFIQEEQAFNSAEKLRSMVKTTCTVMRNGILKEIDLFMVVPGDVVRLSAGDIVPADLRLIQSKDLFINQSMLTGESLPVEKHAVLEHPEEIKNPLEAKNICLTGTNVETGSALGVVVDTGANTYFGNLAKSISGKRAPTSFDKGVDKFTWLMMRFMSIMVPTVFVINGFSKGNWWEAFLFSISIAVGLTPEMLPAIVAINLSQGAIALSKKKVIVKRLNSIQNFGAMDVLCTDKTGTLTQNNIVVIKHVNIKDKDDEKVFHYAFLNSFNQTGFRNLLDSAILKHSEVKTLAKQLQSVFSKIDEVPFDFQRKRLSIVLKEKNKKNLLVCKGAVEEVLKVSTKYEIDGHIHALTSKEVKEINELNKAYAKEGFRVIAIAYKPTQNEREHFSVNDEDELIFLGLMTFLDPPKESTKPAIKSLQQHGVTVKVLTGDNEMVTQKICSEVGLEAVHTLLGPQIENMTDTELEGKVEETTIFAKLSPDHKKRIVMALQKKGHAVGFLGDGINDAPALRTADVGISVDGAVDIAKESADIILLETSLSVLADGVLGGRRVFGNIIKYIKMGASSNFGNMFSVIGASIFVPFLPMTAIQILTNNLLYDVSQTAIPSDKVDAEYLEKPRKWDIVDIQRFMIFIGPLSSIFDYTTYFTMLFIFNAWHNPSLFQTGWFVESLMTQTMIVHVIRSRKMPFIQTIASIPLLIMTFSVVSIGILLTFSPVAPMLGFTRLPLMYWPILLGMLLSYIIITQIVKTWYIKKFGYN